jgi:hypothetical protein
VDQWLFWTAVGITVLVAGAPLVVYAWARLTGALPSQAAWQAQGGNNGPWHLSPLEPLFELPEVVMGLLSAVTVLVTVLRSGEGGRGGWLWGCASGAQFGWPFTGFRQD